MKDRTADRGFCSFTPTTIKGAWRSSAGYQVPAAHGEKSTFSRQHPRDGGATCQQTPDEITEITCIKISSEQ